MENFKIKANINLTGSRLYSYVLIGLGFGLSLYLKEVTAFSIAAPLCVGLYINKQYQERKTNELNIKQNTESV